MKNKNIFSLEKDIDHNYTEY